MEETKKKGRPRKRQEVKVKEDLNINGIKTGRHLSESVSGKGKEEEEKRVSMTVNCFHGW